VNWKHARTHREIAPAGRNDNDNAALPHALRIRSRIVRRRNRGGGRAGRREGERERPFVSGRVACASLGSSSGAATRYPRRAAPRLVDRRAAPRASELFLLSSSGDLADTTDPGRAGRSSSPLTPPPRGRRSRRSSSGNFCPAVTTRVRRRRLTLARSVLCERPVDETDAGFRFFFSGVPRELDDDELSRLSLHRRCRVRDSPPRFRSLLVAAVVVVVAVCDIDGASGRRRS